VSFWLPSPKETASQRLFSKFCGSRRRQSRSTTSSCANHIARVAKALNCGCVTSTSNWRDS